MVVQFLMSEPRRGGEMIAGEPADVARRLADIMRSLGVCR